MSVEQNTIRVGDIVRLHTSGYADPHIHGRVVQVDIIETLQSASTTIYVRWFNCDGKPDDNPSCFAPSELFKCPAEKGQGR